MFVFLFWSMLLSAQNPREIADKAIDAIEFESLEMVSTLKIFDNRGNERIRQVANAIRKFGDVTKTMIRFLAPAEVKGTAMLVFDYDDKPDDMWIYMPALRRTRRIITSEKGKSFMGSEFSNSDMTKPNMEDYIYKLEGSVAISGKDCWIIESRLKDKAMAYENGFSFKIAWIEKGNYLTHKVEYYNLEGKLFKVMEISDYRIQPNGKYFSLRMEVSNLENNRRSLLITDKFQLGSKLPEESFSVAALENQ
jgi:hypothetical protein